MFEDDFKGDKDGEFPAHWKLEAAQALLNKMGDDLALSDQYWPYGSAEPSCGSSTITSACGFWKSPGT